MNADIFSRTIAAVSVDNLVALLQSAGYRAQRIEGAGQDRVHSAAAGLSFSVVPVNRVATRAAERADAFVDFSFRLELQVAEGVDWAVRVERWNRERRFTRAVLQPGVLLLMQDVLLTGGVSRDWLRGQLELWDIALQEFVLFLQGPSIP